MADLDAELLALADGDSSDEGLTNTTHKIDSASSTPGSPRDAVSSSTSRIPPKKVVKSKAGAGKGNRMRRNDPENCEVSSADSQGARSATMSESGEESDGGTVAKDVSIFPVDNKFYSEKDKAEIMSLSEVRREAILAERAEILARKQQDQVLQRLFDGYKADDQKKRKAGAADLEEGQRKSSRQKTTLGGRKVGETSDAMVAYKRQREQKGALAEQRKSEAAERRARKGSVGSDADADGESEVEWDDGKAKATVQDSAPRFEESAELIDFERVRVGRAQFGQVCFYPGFENAIKDCYVRVSIGLDKNTGENVYRVAKIKGFKEGKPYALEAPNGKPFTTNQYAIVAVGKAEKDWPFITCSNSRFTEREFDRYKKTLIIEGFTIPKKASLIAKINDINNLLNHKFTEEELQTKLKRSGVLQQKNVNIERHALQMRRKEAEQRGDKSAIEKIDTDLAALDGPKLAFGTSLVKAAQVQPTVKTQQERLAEINRANRKANTQNVRKAQLAERKAGALQRAAVERGEAVANPFARVKVQATTHHDVTKLHVPKAKPEPKKDDLFEGSDISRAGTPLSGRNSGMNTPMKVKPGIPGRSRRKLEVADSEKTEKQLKLEEWRTEARAMVHDVLMGPNPKTRWDHINFDDELDAGTWELLDSITKTKKQPAGELPV